MLLNPFSSFRFLLVSLLLLVSTRASAQLERPLLALATDQQVVEINWSSVEGATGYRLHYAPYPYLGEGSVRVLDVGLSFSLAGELLEGASYHVSVEAYDGNGASAFSNLETFFINRNHLAYESAPGSARGLTLISPNSLTTSYLIDDFGSIKHQWETSASPRLSAYLMASGNLLKTSNVNTGFFDSGGKGGAIQELDWEGNEVWNFSYSDESKTLHHDIEPLSNGNILALSWEDRGDIWSEVMIEIQKTGDQSGSVVWSWDVFNHLDELGLNPNSANTDDWLHLNAIDYNYSTDQVMVSSRAMDQIWIINKADGSVARVSSVPLSGQHDAKWIDDRSATSNITVYDNGATFSRALELNPQLSDVVFSYGNDSDEFFFSSRISGTQRLANGNTLICSGVDGLIIEVDSEGTKLREHQNILGSNTLRGVSTSIFRAEKYPSNYTPYF